MAISASSPAGTSRVAIVTGGNTGLGYETAKALVEAGYFTIIACRSIQKGKEAALKIEETTGVKNKISVMALDLSSFKSIEEFAAQFRSLGHAHLDVLINNAGVMDMPFQSTKDGFEMQFGVNHLGHFALTMRLLPLLNKAPQGRVVVLTSGSMYASDNIHYDRLQSSKGYSRLGHYAYSKLANMLFTKALDRRLRQAAAQNKQAVKITVNACHPGACLTEISRHDLMLNVVMSCVKAVCRSALVGSMSTVYLALAPEVENVSGEYFVDQIPRMPNPIALNEKAQEELWQKSVEFTGVDFKL
ncbi:Retinol dehydrogenase 12 [Lunasporangiospora selenospora]|uniref:Retinol dehydrogenase 12 n=1 Tax=Lunasporangiospora selenospora TaxID=979761 RepID=A0A9P6G3Z8_9FUNG|nr:Retinol dehydrogenase 12 [Lunasporangiospora selenospora]